MKIAEEGIPRSSHVALALEQIGEQIEDVLEERKEVHIRVSISTSTLFSPGERTKDSYLE